MLQYWFIMEIHQESGKALKPNLRILSPPTEVERRVTQLRLVHAARAQHLMMTYTPEASRPMRSAPLARFYDNLYALDKLGGYITLKTKMNESRLVRMSRFEMWALLDLLRISPRYLRPSDMTADIRSFSGELYEYSTNSVNGCQSLLYIHLIRNKLRQVETDMASLVENSKGVGYRYNMTKSGLRPAEQELAAASAARALAVFDSDSVVIGTSVVRINSMVSAGIISPDQRDTATVTVWRGIGADSVELDLGTHDIRRGSNVFPLSDESQFWGLLALYGTGDVVMPDHFMRLTCSAMGLPRPYGKINEQAHTIFTGLQQEFENVLPGLGRIIEEINRGKTLFGYRYNPEFIIPPC